MNKDNNVIKPYNQVECWIIEPEPSYVEAMNVLVEGEDEVTCWLNVVCGVLDTMLLLLVTEVECDWSFEALATAPPVTDPLVTSSLLALVDAEVPVVKLDVKSVDGDLPPFSLVACVVATSSLFVFEVVDNVVVVLWYLLVH